MNPHAALLLIRPSRASARIAALQIVASCITTLLTFGVAMLASAFWTARTDEIGYRALAFGLVVLLVVPLITLGAASARLAVRSRDARLATLRLLGATSRSVRLLALAEVGVIAALGVLAGTVLALGLPFGLSLLTVHGAPLRASELWLPWGVSASIPLALVAIAVLSALLGLRRVVLSPLGVRTRQEAPTMSWIRLVVAVVVVGAAALVTHLVSPGWGLVVLLGALTAVVLAVMGVLGLVGPFVVALVARWIVERTSDPAWLIAARGLLEDPRAAWRSVSTLALTTFILIPAVSLLGYVDTISRSISREVMRPDQLLLISDARVLLLALAAVSFLVVAYQAAMTQTVEVLEHEELYVALDRIGMRRQAINVMRRRRVAAAASVAVVGATVASVVLAFPVVATGIATAPVFSAAILLVLCVGLLVVWMGVMLTEPVLTRVLGAPGRGE
ncbi:hypothetical protein EDF62_1827 [Leucobacter luti]|uniref:FtsX-like permease family protein n=1 Tax=Leucobacter luti TaxID=340320 RepID=A0A4R6RZM5_9MICO|nr:hypothetical protein [Leucobacter luti]TDP92610.1 hypothetical protein EDF62_1827 [Leucobacter luti]